MTAPLGPTAPPPDPSGADRVRPSTILETVVRLAFHTVLVFGVYLLFAGHNQPGGGFVGGLVAGSAFVLRYVSGGRAELRGAVPVDPGIPLGLGMVVAAATGIASWFLDAQYLQSGFVELEVVVLGDVKLTSPLVFDMGVFLVVVGLVLGLLRTLGAEAER